MQITWSRINVLHVGINKTDAAWEYDNKTFLIMESLSNCMIVLEIKSLALLNTSQEYVEPCVLFLNGRTRSQAKCTLNWVVWTSRSYIISFILQQVQCQWGQKLLECFLCECRNKITLNHAWCKTYTTVKTQVPAWVFGVQATETYVGKLNRPTCARFLKQLYKVQQPFCRVIENNGVTPTKRVHYQSCVPHRPSTSTTCTVLLS